MGFRAGETVTLTTRQLRTEGPPVTVTLPLTGPVHLETVPWGQLRVLAPAGSRVWLERVDCVVQPDGCLTQWLPIGAYRVGVHAADHRIGITTVEMRPGAPTDVEVPLDLPTTAVVGRIVDARGRPVPGVRVETVCGRQEVNLEETGPDGRFRIEGVAAFESVAPVGRAVPRVLRIRGRGWTPVDRPLEVPVEGGELDLGDLVLAALPVGESDEW